MKLSIALLTAFLFVSCSAPSPAPENSALAENKRAKNREIAAANEVTEIIQVAQKLERQGRVFSESTDAASASGCGAELEDRQAKVKELDERIKKLPERFSNALLPVIPDLDACVSCSQEALKSCVKARASVNKAIEEIYPR